MAINEGQEEQQLDAETRQDPKKFAERWITELSLARKREEKWNEESDKIVKKWAAKDGPVQGGNGKRFRIFTSNVNTIRPALYSRTPKVQIERRHRDFADPVGRDVAQVWEKATAYDIDTSRFDPLMETAVLDLLLSGRAVAWCRYEAEWGEPLTDEMGQPVMGSDGQPAKQLIGEKVVREYVQRKDFLHSDARTEEEIVWKARRVYLTRDEMVASFGELGNQPPLSYVPAGYDDEKKKDVEEHDPAFCKAPVWEIWSKQDKKIYFVSEDYGDSILAEKEPPVRLKGFFPCPPALYSNLEPDCLLPVPDHRIYADQLAELEQLNARISLIEEAIRVVGAYDKSQPALARVLGQAAENEMVPIDNWMQFVQADGIDGAMQFLPIEQLTKCLPPLYEARDAKKEAIYEITGISDIIRGTTAPSETATAQQMKGQFATVRLSARQQAVQRFARDLIGITAEIIAENFNPETIANMAGVDLQNPEQAQKFQTVVQVLKNDPIRTYKVDVETDSTIAIDDNAEKEKRNEFMAAFGRFMSEAMEFGQALPPFQPVMMEMLMWAVRGFRAGRGLESSIEMAIQQMMAPQPPQEQQPPPPDPKMIEVQMKGQESQARFQMDMQKMQADLANQQKKLELEYMKLQQDAALKLQELEATKVIEAEKARLKLAEKAMELENTPQNAETQATMRETAPKAPPINVVVNMPKPGKKTISMSRDAMGNLVGEAAEVEDGL